MNMAKQQLFEYEVRVMVKECRKVYGSKDCDKINDWLENRYRPFRKHWINEFGEMFFCDTWNKINGSTK